MGWMGLLCFLRAFLVWRILYWPSSTFWQQLYKQCGSVVLMLKDIWRLQQCYCIILSKYRYTYVYIYALRKCLQPACGSLTVGLQVIFKNFCLLIFLYLTWNCVRRDESMIIVTLESASPCEGRNRPPLSPQALQVQPIWQWTRSLSNPNCQMERSRWPNTGYLTIVKTCKCVWGSPEDLVWPRFSRGFICKGKKMERKTMSLSAGSLLASWAFTQMPLERRFPIRWPNRMVAPTRKNA